MDTMKLFCDFVNENVARIRVSCAGLASIKIGDKYLLVENKKSRSKGISMYGPLGGALEYLPGAQSFLDELEAVPERETPDLRLDINLADVEKFSKWFYTTDDREKSTKREVYEELVDEEKVLSNLDISDIEEVFISSERSKKERFGVVSERFFEVFEIKFPLSIEQKLERIAQDPNSTIRLFTPEQIMEGESTGVGDHSIFIIQ